MNVLPKAVFLSYASEDAEAAQRICDGLRAAGINVWFDKRALRGGDAWDASIRKQVKACSLFVPVISTNTEMRGEGYFRLEWKLAVDRSHQFAEDQAFILPVVIDNTSEIAARVPERFKDVQWTRLPSGQVSTEWAERVARLLAHEPGGLPNEPSPPRPTLHPPVAVRSRAQLVLWACIAILATLILAVSVHYFGIVGGEHADRAVSPLVEVPGNAIPEKSIAVLPFTDMSEKKDQEYFSDGLTESLIDRLTHITELRVIARTSSFSFKGKSDDIRSIGRTLNVANIVEGSVRKTGNRLKITAQLIRTESGEHIWSQTYDGDAKDIFRVQEEISGAVARVLKLTLLENYEPAKAGTRNLEAYESYMQARHQIFMSDDLEKLKQAITFFQKAVALDPKFGKAWASMSSTLLSQYLVSKRKDVHALVNARIAAKRAVDAGSADGYAAGARIAAYADFDLFMVRENALRALAVDAQNTWALVFLAIIDEYHGRLSDAAMKMEHAIELDPLNPSRRRDLSSVYFEAGRLVEAETEYRRASGLAQRNDISLRIAQIRLREGKAEEALTLIRQEPDAKARESCSCLAITLEALGRHAEAESALAKLVSDYGMDSPYSVAQVYAYRRDARNAFDWVEKAIVARDPWVLWLKIDWTFEPFRHDERYLKALEQLHLGS